MPTVTLDDKGCRGCTLCVDICAVDVFDFDEPTDQAKVTRTEDCIGCLSCSYLCPSECIEIADLELVRPFHRSDRNGAFVEKFLQAKMPSKAITTEDWQAAHGEVGLYLSAFADALIEIIGRGQKAVGRRAGNVAAAHLPEMYEDKDLERVLGRLRERMGRSFPFDYQLSSDELRLTIPGCGLHDAVERAGGEVGKHILCQLFHEFWAGLLSSYTGTRYSCEVPEAGATCQMQLKPM